MPTETKVARVADLEAQLADASSFVLTDYRGLRVPDLQGLRRRLRARGIEYHVVKNTLFARAVTARGLPDLAELFRGPTAVALTKGDEVELAKGLVDETRTLKTLKINGGVIRGRLMSAQDIQSLAALPSRTQLEATLVGALQAPFGQLVATLHAPLRELVATLAVHAA